MTTLRLDKVTKTFGSKTGTVTALDGVSFEVREREFLAIVGPSGCGKSTLLQIAAGLMPCSTGGVYLGDRPVNGPPAELVYLFQQYTKSLFPWRTVLANVLFALERRTGLSRAEMNDRAMAALDGVGLAEFARSYPWQLSGGMQQRVAIARALAAEPRVLLLDEPFSSVDALTRLDLQALILDVWTRQPLTVLLVTHDVDEAVYLADRIAVLTKRPSRISEVIDVPLPRPRLAIETREDPQFLEIRHNLLEKLLTRDAGAH